MASRRESVTSPPRRDTEAGRLTAFLETHATQAQAAAFLRAVAGRHGVGVSAPVDSSVWQRVEDFLDARVDPPTVKAYRQELERRHQQGEPLVKRL